MVHKMTCYEKQHMSSISYIYMLESVLNPYNPTCRYLIEASVKQN